MLRHLDLFSGIGGFAYAARMVGGYETVAFCEINEYCQAVLRKHWPGVPIYDDVRRLNVVTAIGPVDVITGGFPCQDISVAGAQAGIEAERSGLWSEIARLIGEIRPRFALMENVTNLLAGDNGRWMQRVLGDLAEIGYDAEWHCVRACTFGFPHARDRVWILAYPASERWHVQDDPAPALLDSGCLQNLQQSGYRWKREARGHSLERVGWTVEPAVCGSDDGIPAKLAESQCHALGNAIVPQVAAIFLQAIKECEGLTA